jgi:hypothetical protein
MVLAFNFADEWNVFDTSTVVAARAAAYTNITYNIIRLALVKEYIKL